MKKIYTITLFLVVTVSMMAQDCYNWRYRINAGPSLDYSLSSDNSVSKGLLVGTTVGLEISKYFDCNKSFTTGLYYSHVNTDRWLINDPDGYSNSKLNANFLEIPLGFKYKFLESNKDLALFVKGELVNSLCLQSRDLKVNGPKIGDVAFESTEATKELVFFNPGFKAEIGLQKRYTNYPKYFTFSIQAKDMYYNALPNQPTRFNILSVGLFIGYIL